MDSGQFFHELFEGMVDTGIFMYVWSPGLGSTYFTAPNEAAAHVEAMKADRDIYYGMGVTKAVLSKDRRPTNLQVCGIPGLWLDVDIADVAHKKQNLPPTREDAIDLLESNLPLKPTILVNSGHGLHAYWLFKEPWLFETEDERIQAATLLRRFVLSFKYHAAIRGWTMDSVFDLARVLRVPGTLNCKDQKNKIPCSVVSFDGTRRFNPDEFEVFLVDAQDAGSDDHISELLSVDKNPLGLTLRIGATPPNEKMETLRTVEPKFEATWERKRPDLKNQSLSSYEMSLVSLTVSYGWGNQEIADAIVAFRRKHGENQKQINKGMRVDYITRTILKARKDQKQEPVDPAVLALSQQAVVGNKDPSKPRPSKDEIRAALEGLLQIRIDKIIKYQCDNPVFEMRLTDGSIVPVGPIDKLITQRSLKYTIAAHRGVVPRTVKSNVWDEYATLMMELIEVQEPLAEDATQKGVLSSMITQYLERHGIVDDMESAFHSSRPFWHKGKAWMFSKHFVNWAKFNAEPINLHEFSMTAKSMGIETDTKHFRIGDGDKKINTTKSVYDVTRFVGAIPDCPMQIQDPSDSPEFGLEVVQ